MSSALENKILNLQERLRAENESRDRDRQPSENGPGTGLQPSPVVPASSPAARRPRQRKLKSSSLITSQNSMIYSIFYERRVLLSIGYVVLLCYSRTLRPLALRLCKVLMSKRILKCMDLLTEQLASYVFRKEEVLNKNLWNFKAN